jgi:hypothetical protein
MRKVALMHEGAYEICVGCIGSVAPDISLLHVSGSLLELLAGQQDLDLTQRLKLFEGKK